MNITFLADYTAQYACNGGQKDILSLYQTMHGCFAGWPWDFSSLVRPYLYPTGCYCGLLLDLHLWLSMQLTKALYQYAFILNTQQQYIQDISKSIQLTGSCTVHQMVKLWPGGDAVLDYSLTCMHCRFFKENLMGTYTQILQQNTSLSTAMSMVHK